jgi:ribosomal protein L40E
VQVTGSAGESGPTRAHRAAPLTRREKSWVAAAAVAPIVVTGLVLLPVALMTTITAADVVGAAIVYGGLLGLAAGFVATDRLQARQCPRCNQRNPRGAVSCAACGYDLVERPRYACSERHLAYLDTDGDGRCECGRWLERLPSARGVGPQVVATLRIGGYLLAFLLAIGLLLNVLEGRL